MALISMFRMTFGRFNVLAPVLIVGMVSFVMSLVTEGADVRSGTGRDGADPTIREPEIADNFPGIRLVEAHLNELMPVLIHLREHQPEQYEKAIRDLERAEKRLESIRRRDEKLYDVALREWQVRGRIDLLKARLRVRSAESDRKALLVEMKALRDIEIERMRLERASLVEREAANRQRAIQAIQTADKTQTQIQELDVTIEKLLAESINSQSPSYLRAIGSDSRSSTSNRKDR